MTTTTDLLAAAHTAAPYHGIALNRAYTPDERLQAALKALDLLTTITDALESDAEAPAPAGPVHLLIGEVPPHPAVGSDNSGDDVHLEGRLLVHVWADGTGEVAYRATDQGGDRWGPPARLEPAP